MKSSVLFVIDSDPRASGRPAEAIRIAAGVAVWKKIEVTVFLAGPAVLVLGEDAGEFVDGENYPRYLPILGEMDRPIFVQAQSECLTKLGNSALPYARISDDELAGMAAERSQVIRF